MSHPQKRKVLVRVRRRVSGPEGKQPTSRGALPSRTDRLNGGVHLLTYRVIYTFRMIDFRRVGAMRVHARTKKVAPAGPRSAGAHRPRSMDQLCANDREDATRQTSKTALKTLVMKRIFQPVASMRQFRRWDRFADGLFLHLLHLCRR
jgi:hypothetical protein